MNLKDIRQKLVQTYGLYRLVDSPSGNWEDKGANFYIQAGLKYLDMRYWHTLTAASYKMDIAAGAYVVEFKSCRAIKEVWVDNGDGRVELEKKTLAWVKENYGSPVADMTRGVPLYYATALFKLSPELRALKTSDYNSQFTYGWEDIIFADEGDAHSYNAIVILPPPDELYTVDVKGYFYSEMLEDTDTSFWSVTHPDALVVAAAMAFEGVNRNEDGASKLERHIRRMLSSYSDDVVEEEIANINQIGG